MHTMLLIKFLFEMVCFIFCVIDLNIFVSIHMFNFFSNSFPHAVVEELLGEHNGNARSPSNLMTISPKQEEISKGPNFCSMQNFLFYFPGIGFLHITATSSHNVCVHPKRCENCAVQDFMSQSDSTLFQDAFPRMKMGIAYSFLTAIIIGSSYPMAMERFWIVYV